MHVIPPITPLPGGPGRPRAALRLAVLVAISVALAGCAGNVGGISTASTGADTKTIAQAPPPPKLENGDKLRVTVFNEPQLSGEFTVDGSGSIAFPLIGQVEVANLDGREVEQRLTERLAGRYLVNPKIAVEIVSHRPFYVLGEVVKAGEYPYRPGLNAVSAIALAGGFTPRAATNYIILRRANDSKPQEVALEPGVLIHPGDMITVPERLF
jgi:polysaccharide export outer membrane protein